MAGFARELPARFGKALTVAEFREPVVKSIRVEDRRLPTAETMGQRSRTSPPEGDCFVSGSLALPWLA